MSPGKAARPRSGLGLSLGLSLVLGASAGCGGPLVRLAKKGEWAEADAHARSMKRVPQDRGARAWARALVELGSVDEARAVLLRDFRKGGREASLLELAELESSLGLRGLATAHYARLVSIDLDAVSSSESAAEACALLRERARALASLGEALGADADMRRVAAVCPETISDADRGFLAELRPRAEAQARGQRALQRPVDEGDEGDAAGDRHGAEGRGEALELARRRGPRAVAALALAEGRALPADDVAVLLAAEFSGALGPGLVSARRLSSWIGDSESDELLEAVDTLPDGVREYALLRVSSVREEPRFSAERQGWIVAAMAALDGQGSHEAAKGWRVHAVAGDLGSAEFVLNTNLRDMIVPEVQPESPGSSESAATEPAPIGLGTPWSLRVPVERRSFDLLLTLARLLESRGKAPLALELRRRVIVEGAGAGLAQVAGMAADEVRRQLALGHPWQALAVAEVVPGPLADEVLPAIASSLGLAKAAGVSLEDDRKVVWRVLGDPWFASWEPRLDTARVALDLGAEDACPGWAAWIDEGGSKLGGAGLDAQRSGAALRLALGDLDGAAVAPALVAAIESDLGLTCSAPLVPLLHGGLHQLALAELDEALVQAPELGGAGQKQLHAELALAHGESGRAEQLTIAAAAISATPSELWARAAIAGRSYGDRKGAREYTILALRELLAHESAQAAGGDLTGARGEAVRRELVLMRLRDVDSDPQLRSGGDGGLEELRALVAAFVAEAPPERRWQRLDGLIEALAAQARADELAWSVLDAALLDATVRGRHPHAVAAFEAARVQLEGSLTSDSHPPATPGASPGAPGASIDPLSDADTLCEGSSLASVGPSQARWLGAAAACGPKLRAEALAQLVEFSDTPRVEGGGGDVASMRDRVLLGPVAVELVPGQRGALRSVAALSPEAGGDLALRVATALPLGPVWVVALD